MTQAALLTGRAVLAVAGPDARTFLQGIVTNDINKCDRGRAIYAGLLTPQGKILFDFFVVPAVEGFFLETARALLADLANRLAYYRLRAKVEIVEEPDMKIAALWNGEIPALPSGVIAYTDPRLAALGSRVLLPSGIGVEALGCTQSSEADYHDWRIGLGVPEGGRDYAYGETFPHEALFDQLNGVDFGKGCFVGQEVVSRMQHRGTARRRVVPVEASCDLPRSGTEVFADDTALGVLGSVTGKKGLAMLRLDRAEEALAAGKAVKAASVQIRLRKPDWLRIPMPAEARA